MEPDTVSINTNTPPEEEKTVPISEPVTAPIPDFVTAAKRAVIANYGSQQYLNQDTNTIQRSILAGNEPAIRTDVASSVDKAKSDTKLQMYRDISAKLGHDATPEQFAILSDPNFELNRRTDPDTVFEYLYGKKFVNTLDEHAADMGTSVVKVNNEEGDPMATYLQTQYEGLKSLGAEYIAKNKYIDARLADLQANANNQSWAGWGLDTALSIIPGYNDIKLRQNVGGVSSWFGLLGNNLESQSKDLYNLPLPQFKQEFDTAISNLNPQLAVQFAQAMKGMSTSDVWLDNAFTAIDLSTIGGVYKGVGKLATVGIKTVTGAAEAEATAAAAKKYNAIVQTVKDSVKAGADDSMPVNVATATGAGDIKEAAVQKLANEIATPPTDTGFSGKTAAIAKLLRYIPSVFDNYMNDFKAGNNLSNSMVNILDQDRTNLIARVSNALIDVWKGDRVPFQNATADQIRQVVAETLPKYANIEDGVLDTDIWVHPTTKVKYLNIDFANPDKQLFVSKEAAQGFSALKGFPEVDVLEKPTTFKVAQDITDETLNPELQRLSNEGGPVPFKYVEQQGVGYYLRMSVPIDESSPIMRTILKGSGASAVDISEGFSRWLNGYFGKYRTSEETLSKVENEQRKIATNSPKAFIDAFESQFKYIQDIKDGVQRLDEFGNEIPWYKRKPATFFNRTLNIVQRIETKKKFDDFMQVVRMSQSATDPVTGELGKWAKDQFELNKLYRTVRGSDASFDEIRAYQAVKNAYEFERLIRNFSEYKNMSRLGAETHSFKVKMEDGSVVKSPEYTGMRETSLGPTDERVLIVGENGEHTISDLNKLGNRLKVINEGAKNGELTITRLYNSKLRPFEKFQGIGDQRIDYVVANNIESKQLDLHQVAIRQGGHFVYDTPKFIKQANTTLDTIKGVIKRANYEGDNTLMGVMHGPMGEDIANKVNQVLVKLRLKDEAGAKEVFDANKLPFDYNQFRNWFRGTTDRDTGKTVPPRFNLHEDFMVVDKGKSIYDSSKYLQNKYGNIFADRSKTGSPSDMFKNEFTTYRDNTPLGMFVNEGSAEDPVYKYVAAPLIDPVTMLNRGLGRIVHSSFMDDYKLFAINKWLEDAKPYLKFEYEREVNSSPFSFFHNMKENMFSGNADKATRGILMANHGKIMQFVGIPDEFNQYVQQAAQKLSDYMYTKYGPEANRSTLNKMFTVLPVEALARITDPITFVRSMTFHFKLGLGNVAQALVQAQSFTNIMALSPKHALTGAYGSFLYRWSAVNGSEEIMNALDNYATKIRIPGMGYYKPGEFTEAVRELNNNGYAKVKGEYTLLNNQFNESFLKGDFKKLLDFGDMWFREGEQFVRTSSWFTAFKEWRDANPLRTITDADRAAILDRADLLNNNMTRASNSILHTGVLSLPTQFLSYQIRLGELFWGKRISNMDRARMVMFNMGMYGIPSAFGVAGIPATETIRQKAEELGYVPGEKFLNSLFMEGAPAMALSMITGKQYDVGDRLGIQGMTQFRDALRSDHPWWNLFGGAASSTLTNTITSVIDPFMNKAMSYINDDGKYPLKIDDFLDMFNEISSASAARKLYMALNTGKWMSRNEQYLTDTTKMQAIFQTLTGLQPQEINEMYAKMQNQQDIAKWQREAQNIAIKELRRGFVNNVSNPDQATSYMNRAQSVMTMHGFDDQQMATTWARAMNGYESAVDQTETQYLTRVPNKTTILGIPKNDLRETRMDQYSRQQQMKEKNQ